MPNTQGINHLGLSVNNLDESVNFFVECLGWKESGRDNSYPRSSVSDGVCRLTLWQVDHDLQINSFHRRKNIGLHHLALTIESEEKLNDLSRKVKNYPKVKIEFMPELLGTGPRKHMMFYSPSGLRIELIWLGT